MTTLNLEERIRNGQCHMAHQNSAREENYGGKHMSHYGNYRKVHAHISSYTRGCFYEWSKFIPSSKLEHLESSR